MRGSRVVGFDDDHPMHGTESSPTRNHGSPNRRGGRNKSNPTRNQTWKQQHQHGQNPFNTSTQANNRNNFGGQRGRGGRGGRGGGQGGRGGRGGRGRNTSIFNDAADDVFRDIPPARAVADDQGSDDSSSSSSLSTYPNFNGNGNNGPRVRFCTECSAVRRANLRFRNLVARALKRCSEHFVAWAEEAGVGFGTCDEMDWQPEPVTRVLLLAPPPAPPPPPSPPPSSPKHFSPMFQTSPFLDELLREHPQPQEWDQQQQHYHQQQSPQQQHHQQYQQYKPDPLSTATTPTPGPWPWPPWEKPPVVHRRFGTPAFSAPAFTPVPTTAPIADITPSGGGQIDGLSGTKLPVSGFGMLGAAAAATPGAPLSSRIIDQLRDSSSLRWDFT